MELFKSDNMSAEQVTDWRSEQFRRKVITQIDEAIRSSASPMSKSSMEMENHVFLKAKSREEYLALVARLILHVKEMNAQKEKEKEKYKAAAASGLPQGMSQVTGGMPQQQMQDPLKSLQTLTMQGTGGIVPGQQQQQQQPGMMTQQQQAQLQQQRQLVQQQQMIQQQRLAAMQANQRPPLQRQDAFIVTSAQHVQAVTQPLPASGNTQTGYQQMPTGPIQQRPGPVGGMVQQSQPSPYGQAGIGQQPGQLDPSPIQQMSQPTPSPKSVMMTSSSPQSGVSPSPVSRGGTYGIPSPSSALNTPSAPTSQSHVSPAPRSHEEQAYLDKLNKLSKFIEPLRRMINRLSNDKDEERKKDKSKMEGLFKILTDPTQRLPMATLLKCEQVLDKLELSSKPSVSTTPVAPTGTVSTHMCHPLIDVVAAHIQSNMFNHCLQQTFGPAMMALYGSPIRAPSPPPKKRKRDELEEEDDIPHILQGEIARLGNRFRVNLDPTQHTDSKAIHLLCKIDDKNLPSVPPIAVTVPECYPEASPECDTTAVEYESSQFLQSIQKILSTLLLRMPKRYTFTELLDKWEMSIRRACAAPS